MEYPHNHPADASRHAATDRDQARQVATSDDYISVKEAQALFIARGREVTERTLQRSCAKNHLTGQKVMTNEGEKWFVLKSSVLHRIAELEEFDRLRASRQDAASRVLSPSVAEQNTNSFTHDIARQATEPDTSSPTDAEDVSHATQPDVSRHAAASPDASRQRDETVERNIVTVMSERERELYEKLVTNYEDQIEDLIKDKSMLQEDKKMLVEQLISKDKQIEHFFSSERDTKKLFGSLQNIMTYLWPNSKRKEPHEELPQAYGPVVRDMPDGLDEREGK
jgi:hypothetical protein